MSSGISSDKVDILLGSSGTLRSSMDGLRVLKFPEKLTKIKICIDNVKFSQKNVPSFHQILTRAHDP